MILRPVNTSHPTLSPWDVYSRIGISFSFFCWWLFTAIAAVVGFKIFNEDAGAKDDEAAFMGAADPDPISDTHQEVPYSAMDDDDTTVVARS